MKELIAHAASIASMKEKERRESSSKHDVSKDLFTKNLSKDHSKEKDNESFKMETNPMSEVDTSTSKIKTPKSALPVKKETAKMVRIRV